MSTRSYHPGQQGSLCQRGFLSGHAVLLKTVLLKTVLLKTGLLKTGLLKSRPVEKPGLGRSHAREPFGPGTHEPTVAGTEVRWC